MGCASDGGGRARPPGRALRLFGGSQVGTPARGKLRRCIDCAVPGAERTAPQPLRYVPLQRAHGAAFVADARLPSAAALRYAFICRAAVAADPLDHGSGSRGDSAARGGDHFLGADRDLACAGAVRGGDPETKVPEEAYSPSSVSPRG